MLLVLGCGGQETAIPQPKASVLQKTLQGKDGLSLAATLYPETAPGAPGLILVHRYAADRSTWGELVPRLQEAGYVVISFDLRGHGDSTGSKEKPLHFKAFGAAEWEAAEGDIGLAKAALLEAGADPMRIGMVGESIGANLAMRYAVDDLDIAALALVSPGLNYKGVSCVGLAAGLKERPLLLMAAEQDAYAASSARTLHAEAPGFSELRMYPGSAHGTELFAESPKAVQELLMWLERNFAQAKTPVD